MGTRTSGVQMHSVQAARPQEMPQGGPQAVLEHATAADAEHGISDDRQERRSTTA